MKICLITFEDGISNVGFRRLSAAVKAVFPETITYIYNVGGVSSQAMRIVGSGSRKAVVLNQAFISEVSHADVIGFSGMSTFAPNVKEAISAIRGKSKALIVWGGIHATVFPEDAIGHADAVCIGEGEKSFIDLLVRRSSGRCIQDTPGFWFRGGDVIKKNPLLPLLNNSELGELPFQDYGFDIRYVTSHSMNPMTRETYISQQGTMYMTMWSMGCCFSCAYCSNSRFLKNNKEQGHIRHPVPERIISELMQVLKCHDYITYIELVDDNILLVSYEDLERFCILYREKIGLPLFIPGLHPLTVDAKKMQLLVSAGMKKLRMGIQSGSERILKFYKRNTPIDQIEKSAKVLASFYPKTNPPYYDIILDNPIETDDDKEATLELIRRLPRPYMLYIYSLRVLPGTELWDYAIANDQYHFMRTEDACSYTYALDKRMAFLTNFLALCNPGKMSYGVFRGLSRIKRVVLLLLPLIQLLYMLKRLYYELKIGNYQPLAMASPRALLFFIKMRDWFGRRSPKSDI